MSLTSVRTAKGTIELTSEEYALLEHVLSGTATMEEGQRLYQSTSSRDLPFPMEWEVHLLRATLAELPKREDIAQRLAVVEAELSRQSGPTAEAIERLAWERAWARFASTSLLDIADPNSAVEAHARCFADTCTLLSNPHFGNLDVGQRVATILAIHDTLMSVPSLELVLVADLGLRQFRKMLDDPALTDAQAMGVYDALHSMYFSGVTDVLDLRRFDSIVPPFEDWLAKRCRLATPLRVRHSVDDRLTIAYLLHTAHFDRGNAVSHLIVSLANMHASVPGRRVLLYLIQYVGSNFLADVAGSTFRVRSFPQARNYERIEEIAAALREDNVDVVITEQNRSIAAALFVRRVAPLQIWADTGFPFWNLRSLDWTLSPARTGAPDAAKRESTLRWRQSATTLRRNVEPAEVARIRNNFPADAFILGVFVRLIKLNERFLALLDELLATEPAFRLVITGTGDATVVRQFMARSEHTGRIIFLNENVDLNVYGKGVDVMCDTFPFIGGNACREVAAHGTPVVAMLGTPWDAFLREDRSADLLARNTTEYIYLVKRLFHDGVFRNQQRQIALEMFERQIDPKQMIDDAEAGIAAAGTLYNDTLRSTQA